MQNAIVWQSRITAGICDQLRSDGWEQPIRDKTGLVLDAYFSGTKIKFILDQHPGLRERARHGEVLFGTVDSYLIWRLTGGKCHITDVSNASRTMLFDIHKGDWAQPILDRLNIPRSILPDSTSSHP